VRGNYVYEKNYDFNDYSSLVYASGKDGVKGKEIWFQPTCKSKVILSSA